VTWGKEFFTTGIENVAQVGHRKYIKLFGWRIYHMDNQYIGVRIILIFVLQSMMEVGNVDCILLAQDRNEVYC
jgi:hypothetical protein